jgi:outer membrane murein-binding lipoprotein Lpp
MTNPTIQTDIAEILRQINSKLDQLSEDVTELKVGQAKIEGKIVAVDEKLSGQMKALDTKVEQLEKRIGNSELTNRGILIGLVVIILGGAAKLFGFMGNP